MYRTYCLILALGCCWFSLAASLFAQTEPVQSEQPTASAAVESDVTNSRPKSLLDELADSQAFFKLLRKGTGLSADVESDILHFKPLSAKLLELSKGNAAGSSNSPRLWIKRTSSQKLFSKFARGNIKLGWNTFPAAKLPEFGFAVQFTEHQSPYCKVEMLLDFETDAIRIRFSRQSDNFAFNFIQSETGEITVQEISNDDVFAVVEKDFVALQQKHGRRLTQSIAEILDYIRVEPPASKYSDVVVRQVLSRVQPVDPQIESEFKQIVEELTGGKFAEREAKSKQLLGEYDKWQKYIHSAAKSDEVPAETRSRLRKIIAAAASKTQKQDYELLLNSKLEEDPEYLFWLLENQIIPLTVEDRKNVFNKLRLVSQQSFADETLVWKNWLAKTTVPAPKRDYSKFSSNIKLDSLDGPINRLQDPISRLVQLKFDGGNVKIDKQKWAELFGNKETSELIQGAEQYLKQNNLPGSWLTVGGFFHTNTTSYPQLLFESLRVSAENIESEFDARRSLFGSSRSYERIAPHSRNREFVSKVTNGRLWVHDELPFEDRKLIVQGGNRIVNPPALKNKEEPIAEHYFQLLLNETVAPFRSFLISTNPAEGFRLRIEFGIDGGFISLVESKTKAGGKSEWRLVDVRAADVFVASASSLGEMMKQNRSYFSSELVPILLSLGIQWPNAPAQNQPFLLRKN